MKNSTTARRISFLISCILLLVFLSIQMGMGQNTTAVNVGVVLDLETEVTKIFLASINISLSDFYAKHSDYRTKLILNIRDSKQSVVGAAAAALDLIKNKEVQAILGPWTSMQAHFLINMGNESHVPIISFSATSPSLASLRSPYFVRATHDDSSQVKAISAIVKLYRWREVVPIYVDDEFGEGIVPYLIDALLDISVRIPYRSVLSPSASDDQILEELYKLMAMPTRVFILHTLPHLGSRLFAKAKEIGMMGEGYVWIVTTGMADLVNLLKESDLESMQGVLGVKTYVPKSKELKLFESRWREKFQGAEPNNFGFWAYDATALAMAVEKAASTNFGFDKTNVGFDKTNVSRNATDLEAFGVSKFGPKLLEEISSITFRGLAGGFHLVNGQLQVSAFKIINVDDTEERPVGFWTPSKGLVKRLKSEGKSISSTWRSDLRPITWPGDTISVPKGWEIPTKGKKLRIAVPKKDGFSDFVKVTRDPITKETTVTGFCIELFDTVIKSMPYAVTYEYIPFETPDGEPAGDYNDMVYSVFRGEYDAAVGDTTILANRSSYVDFALPYSETGIAFVVPVKDKKDKSALTFSKPLTLRLWLTTAAFFFYIGIIIWIFERERNTKIKDLGTWEQVSTMLWFSFSTLFFAHREKVWNICSRILVILWCFVVLILTQSYTASLTSLLTVQQLQPTVTSINDLIKNGDYIGYQRGSFVFETLKQMGFQESKLKTYNSPEELHELFFNSNGKSGIAAAFDEVPYINLFMGQYCSQYTVIEPKFKADGFGFAFPIASPLVPDVSRAVLNVTEGEKMKEIENAWFKKQVVCPDPSTLVSSSQLDITSFEALFVIVFGVSLLLLFGFLLHERIYPASAVRNQPGSSQAPFLRSQWRQMRYMRRLNTM